MSSISEGQQWRESPPATFSRRFAELYAAAGNPTLRRVSAAAQARMRAGKARGQTGGASLQRISDWKAGRNVPARFETFAPVLLTLIDEARKSSGLVGSELLSLREWERLWSQANAWSPDDEDTRCPYPGLRSYRADDAPTFFGRDRVTAELAEMVGRVADGPGGMVILVGASGSGKSSLLHAGLVPALTASETGWAAVTLTPGADPVTALTAATAHLPTTGRRLVVVDQLEELFTLCADSGQIDEFLKNVEHVAVPADAAPTGVVAAVRADFYARCLDHAVLEEALKHRSYLLGPMRLNELAAVIARPASLAGYKLEPGLEELIITELCGLDGRDGRSGYEPGALPLLSHVMATAWDHRSGGRLTIESYRKAGGVRGSVAATAERAWDELSESQQVAGKHVLLGLVNIAQDARDTRRKVSLADMAPSAAGAGQAAVEVLARSRLVTLDAESVYLTHEIVLDAWPRMRSWIDEDRVGYAQRQHLQSDAEEWIAHNRDMSRLYRGPRLESAREHADRFPLTPTGMEFLTASVAAARRTRRRWQVVRAALLIESMMAASTGFGFSFVSHPLIGAANFMLAGFVLGARFNGTRTRSTLDWYRQRIAWRR